MLECRSSAWSCRILSRGGGGDASASVPASEQPRNMGLPDSGASVIAASGVQTAEILDSTTEGAFGCS